MGSRPKRGDWVEIRSPDEISATLDGSGAVDHLPFMPEMIPFCGQRFRVASRVVKTCFYGRRSTILSFRGHDVVTLEETRCSGAAHDGCQKQCTIFWRDCWLRKVDGDASQPPAIESAAKERLRHRLKTMSGPQTYFCQASELLRAADQLSTRERFKKALEEVQVGNCGALEMARRVGIWLYWRIRRKLVGYIGQGDLKSTPSETLLLHVGERVRVKPIAKISETLDGSARNRGLSFTPDMRRMCDRSGAVKQRLDKIIVDGTGEMRQMRNTVFLDGSHCGCAHVTFGGCPRAEFTYWREIWLRRSADDGGPSSTEAASTACSA